MSTSPAIKELQDEVVEEFELFEDWQDRYAHIIELGRALERLDESFKTDAYKVRGCQSQVWMHTRMENGRMVIEAESDALIVQGLIAILLRIYSGQPPRDILRAGHDFMDRMGLRQHLSPNRTNGLVAMMKKIHAYAAEFSQEVTP